MKNNSTSKVKEIVYDRNKFEIVFTSDKVIIRPLFNKQDWAHSILEKFLYKYSVVTDHEHQIIYVSRRSSALEKPKIGYAICSPKDKFSYNIGDAIAICRAEGIKIPAEIFRD